MASILSILNAYSHVSSHDYKATNLKALDIWTINQKIINRYAIDKLNLYKAATYEDFYFWTFIHEVFENLEARHFDELDSTTLKIIMTYSYLYGY